MKQFKKIKNTCIVFLWMTTSLTAQGIGDFIGSWEGTETLESPTYSYDNRNIAINIMEGGNRVGFLIFNSSSDFLFNEDLDWAYHYFGLDKDNNEIIFVRRYITTLGLLGNEEIRYTLVEWTPEHFVAEHISEDGDTYHTIRMDLNVLELDDLYPKQIRLSHNFPNPFNPSTTISVEIDNEVVGSLVIYNITGQVVKVIHQGTFSSGISHFHWNGNDVMGKPVSGGTYFYRLKTDGFSQSYKMVLLK